MSSLNDTMLPLFTRDVEPAVGIEVFFNQPLRPVPLDRLLADIRSAKQGLAVATAWFTDTHIAQAIIDSPAEQKLVVLNGGDVNRGDRAAVKMLERAFSGDDHDFWTIYAVGGADWSEGIMHNKIIVVDEDIAWTGSYNLTFQARKNYETLLRITQPAVVKEFFRAINRATYDAWVFDSNDERWKTHEWRMPGDIFRCANCRTVSKLPQEVQLFGLFSYLCDECWEPAHSRLDDGTVVR